MQESHKQLLAHIEQLNAKTKAWVAEDPKNRWAGILTTDLDHWLGYGIETVEQFERYEVETEHWELYRSIHGIKPRWMDYKSMSVEEIQDEIDRMIACRKAEIAAEKAEKERVDAIKKDAFDLEGHSAMHSLSNAFGN